MGPLHKPRKAKSESKRVVQNPYELITVPQQICDYHAHHKSKRGSLNCKNNPWCCFGLGEDRDGIWAKQNPLITKVECLSVLRYPPFLLYVRCMYTISNKILRAPTDHPGLTAFFLPSASHFSFFVNQLGEDLTSHLRRPPNDDDRLAQNSPSRLLPKVGLKNLGATCYLNVLIQCLFHNLLIRDAVHNMDTTAPAVASSSLSSSSSSSSPSSIMSRAVTELQIAFESMNNGLAMTHSLVTFASLLGLNHGEQQDPLEFNRLFLDKFEKQMGKWIHSLA